VRVEITLKLLTRFLSQVTKKLFQMVIVGSCGSSIEWNYLIKWLFIRMALSNFT